MFAIRDIQEMAVGLVGFRPQTGLPAPLTESRSGLRFEGASSLVTIETIKAIKPENGLTTEEYLTELIKEAFVEVINQIFATEDHIATTLINPKQTEWTVMPAQGFVGYKITLPANGNIAIAINRLLVSTTDQLPTGQLPDLPTIYVFAKTAGNTHVAGQTPVQLQKNTVNITAAHFHLTARAYNNEWYVGFYAENLTDDDGTNYNLAGQSEANPPDVLTDYGIEIEPVNIPEADPTTGKPLDTLEANPINWLPMLNLDISIVKDFTELIEANIYRFAKALQLQFAANILTEIINSPRSNRIERISKSTALFELDGSKWSPETPEHIGIIGRLKNEVETIRATFIPKGNKKATLG